MCVCRKHSLKLLEWRLLETQSHVWSGQSEVVVASLMETQQVSETKTQHPHPLPDWVFQSWCVLSWFVMLCDHVPAANSLYLWAEISRSSVSTTGGQWPFTCLFFLHHMIWFARYLLFPPLSLCQCKCVRVLIKRDSSSVTRSLQVNISHPTDMTDWRKRKESKP